MSDSTDTQKNKAGSYTETVRKIMAAIATLGSKIDTLDTRISKCASLPPDSPHARNGHPATAATASPTETADEQVPLNETHLREWAREINRIVDVHGQRIDAMSTRLDVLEDTIDRVELKAAQIDDFARSLGRLFEG